MSEIANLLQQKVGLSPEKSEQAERVIVEHIMARVPPQFKSMLGSVLGTSSDTAGSSTETAASGGVAGMPSTLTGLLGGDKT